MDNSHVALVAVQLKRDGFRSYRCDHPMPLGVNLGSLTKVLKCSKDDDVVTLRAEDNADVLSLKFEAKSRCFDFVQDVFVELNRFLCPYYACSHEIAYICIFCLQSWPLSSNLDIPPILIRYRPCSGVRHEADGHRH
jgi:proliferating cell nuclear antigen